jgi:hypothetical protein
VKGLDEKIAAVQQAEAECNRQRRDVDLAWHQLKGEVRRSATPARIVVSGLVLGFASGFTTSRAASAASGKLVAGPIFSMLLETVLPAALAGFTAMQADADPTETDGEEPADVEAPAPAVDDPVPATKPRARRKRRVDSAA